MKETASIKYRFLNLNDSQIGPFVVMACQNSLAVQILNYNHRLSKQMKNLKIQIKSGLTIKCGILEPSPLPVWFGLLLCVGAPGRFCWEASAFSPVKHRAQGVPLCVHVRKS